MIQVHKANGKQEPFSEEKVIASIHRAGISKDLQADVLSHVKSKLREGIPTSEIYHHITEFLGHSNVPYAKTKYSLKQSIMDLGPTGYPFEDYIAQILTLEGYTTQVRQVLQGACISHEIDVIAEKKTVLPNKIMVEAKFHNATGIETNVHVPMYTKSRFEDVKEKYGFTKALLVTNTKATTDAIAFAACVSMDLISWSYPEKGSLRELVEKYQLFPITALDALPKSSKEKLLMKGIVLCKDLCKNHHLIDELGLDPVVKEKVLAEASFVCNIEH